MADYYIWTGDHASLDDSGPIGDELWLTGSKLVAKPKKLAFKRTRVRPVSLPDVMSLKYGLLVLSPKAMSVMEAVGVTNLEYVPIQIQAKSGRAVDTSYCMVNIVGSVDCLDRKRATLTTFVDTDEVSWVQQYRLVDRKLSNNMPLVFRLGEFHYHSLAHASVKAACEAAKLRGASFVATKDFV
jgi:hypothetical protein